MVEKIIWSKNARSNLYSIFGYWNERNGSNLYCLKLSRLFIDQAILLSKYPEIGRQIENKNQRFIIVKEYYLFYEVKGKHLKILDIRDMRRDV